jgi:hypothetical protein
VTFTPHDIRQRSPEWFQLRIGLVTGSCADAIIAVRKKGTGELEVRKSLRRRLVAERITGLPVDETPFLPAHMERGMELEPQAFAAYEAVTAQIAKRVGFVSHNTMKTGASPDGYVGEWDGEHGLIELKVPKITTHLEYLQDGVVPDCYRGQILHGMWLTGAAWCDFCSFDPRYPESIELFRVRVERDQEAIDAYGLALALFLSEVARDEEAIRERMKQQEAA